MSFRWTEDALQAFEKRAESWRKNANVTTHLCDGDVERLRLPQQVKLKYHNRKTEYEGIEFASQKEATRWAELRLLENAMQIRNLRRQVHYDLVVNGIRVCGYIADFVYDDFKKVVVEDVKGYCTREYKLKRKLMKACHGVEILET